MIRTARFNLCASCGQRAHRACADDGGEMLYLCDRCPSPEEIRRQTATIRERWTETEYRARHYGCSREQAANMRQLCMLINVPLPSADPTASMPMD